MKPAPSKFNRAQKFTLSLIALTFALTACETAQIQGTIGGQFWQRTSASSALYLRGPKAQQILHRDFSRCIVELRELERLGAIKNAIPTDLEGHVLTAEEMRMADWDSPERNKHLFAEHSDYTDFEGCMTSKGWERIEHVPYDIARKGRENYLKADSTYKAKVMDHSRHDRQTTQNTQNTGDYGNLNAFKHTETKGFNE